MYSLAQIRAEFFLALNGTSEGQFPSFLVIRGLFGPELVVNDLESTCFFYSSVDGTTVRAVHRLSSEGIYRLCERLAGQVLEIRPAEASEVVSSVFLPK